MGCYIWYSEEGTGRGPRPIKGLMFYLLNRLVNHFVGYASYVVISDVIMTEDEMSQSQEAKNRTIAWIGLAYTAIVLNKPFFDSR